MVTTVRCLRPMVSEDLQRVLAWRNHESVRRYMYTQHEIALHEHSQWFERASKDANRHLLIFEVDGVPFGFINIHRVATGGLPTGCSMLRRMPQKERGAPSDRLPYSTPLPRSACINSAGRPWLMTSAPSSFT